MHSVSFRPPRTMTTPLLILEGTPSSTPTKPYKPPPPILPSKISTSVPNSKPALPPPPKKKVPPSRPLSPGSSPKARPPVPLPATMKGPRARVSKTGLGVVDLAVLWCISATVHCYCYGVMGKGISYHQMWATNMKLGMLRNSSTEAK